MVPAVFNDRAGVFEDGEVGRPAGREVTHGARLPDERREVWLPRFQNQGIGTRLIEHALDELTHHGRSPRQ